MSHDKEAVPQPGAPNHRGASAPPPGVAPGAAARALLPARPAAGPGRGVAAARAQRRPDPPQQVQEEQQQTEQQRQMGDYGQQQSNKDHAKGQNHQYGAVQGGVNNQM